MGVGKCTHMNVGNIALHIYMYMHVLGYRAPTSLVNAHTHMDTSAVEEDTYTIDMLFFEARVLFSLIPTYKLTHVIMYIQCSTHARNSMRLC